MFEIILANSKKFYCDENTTIFEAAKKEQILLEHSCLSARCRSCLVKIISGHTVNNEDELVLSVEEKQENYVLSCNAKPKSNLVLDITDLGDETFIQKMIVPAKVNSIVNLTNDILKVVLRLPPSTIFKFNPGQYVNIIKGDIIRSYSISSYSSNNYLEFFIKKYDNGLMSNYWFNHVKVDDLLRLEGPLGTFFLRKPIFSNVVFLATGTGVAPVKAILESINQSNFNFKETKIWVITGARYETDIFWIPKTINKLNITFIPVLSKPGNNWNGECGYVQNVVLKLGIDLSDSQVYACGSLNMIESAKKLLIQNSLNEKQFFSDAFVETN